MPERLLDIRQQLDVIDRSLLSALAQRLRLIDEVAAVKAEAGYPVRDPAREAEMFTRLQLAASEAGVDPQLITAIFQTIIAHSVDQQQTLLAG